MAHEKLGNHDRASEWLAKSEALLRAHGQPSPEQASFAAEARAVVGTPRRD